MEYDSEASLTQGPAATSPKTSLETHEYWLDGWADQYNTPLQQQQGSLLGTWAPAAAPPPLSTSIDSSGGPLPPLTSLSTDISDGSASSPSSSTSPSAEQLFLVAALSTASFFVLSAVMALIVWQCCRLKRSKSKHGSGSSGEGAGASSGDGSSKGTSKHLQHLGADEKGFGGDLAASADIRAPPSYFQKQGESLVLVRSDSKGDGFHTSVCRASDDTGDNDDDSYYYRPALPRSISAPLKDFQALKIAPANTNKNSEEVWQQRQQQHPQHQQQQMPNPGPQMEQQNLLMSFLGAGNQGPPPSYAYSQQYSQHLHQQRQHQHHQQTRTPSAHHPSHSIVRCADAGASSTDENGTDEHELLLSQRSRRGNGTNVRHHKHQDPHNHHHHHHDQQQQPKMVACPQGCCTVPRHVVDQGYYCVAGVEGCYCSTVGCRAAYGSSGGLEIESYDDDDPYAGCDINPDLKSRSLPNWLKKKPASLVPIGGYACAVPMVPNLKFTKKMKNRMKNDTAAIIALAKSTTDCCEAARNDTEKLLVGPKVVYEERTNL